MGILLSFPSASSCSTGKFFNETMQGLLEAIAIKNDEIKVIEVPNMAAKTLRSKDAANKVSIRKK